MSILTEIELDKLSVMYEGDAERDASAKIRGYLFQDFVVIKCLLQERVKYVCSEYLEDVDVFFEDGRFEFIQVKYYPKSNPKMKEILTDLYYQYLRLQVLQSNLKAVPRLYVHGHAQIKNPTLEDMKNYIGIENELPESIRYSDIKNPADWLRDNIYWKEKGKKKKNNKEEQKKNLFKMMSSKKSLEEFVTKFKVIYEQDINQYKENVMKVLYQVYPNLERDKEQWQCILLGLAVSYVQRRYMLVDADFCQLRIVKKEFDNYMMKYTQTKTEQIIISYLSGVICEKYGEIINNNDLTDLQTQMLNIIRKNTICWINEISKNIDGQYQLLNTYSMDDADKIISYKGENLDDRLRYMAECKQNFLVFLEYLWKIILNICQNKINDEDKIYSYLELFNPFYYMDRSVTEYVCFNFPEDKYVDCSVILPRVGGNFKGVKRKIVERMVNVSPKPQKWFFENSKIMKGKNYYKYSTANVNENPTIADLGDDSFYIECMECIGVDEGEWSEKEICDDCIFSEECIKEGK